VLSFQAGWGGRSPPVPVLAGVLDLGLGVLEADVEEGGEVGPGLVPVEAVLLAPADPGPVGPDEAAELDAGDPGDVGELLPGEAGGRGGAGGGNGDPLLGGCLILTPIV
jgi:hypothetical protein